MGLLSFLKKKEPSLPVMGQPQDPRLLTDLPSIDMTSIEGSSMERLSTTGNPLNDESDLRSMSVNLPSLDFSMPLSDDALEVQGLTGVQGQSMQKKVAEPFQPPAPLDNQELHDMQGNDALSVEDLNKLFLSDDWKEPDWKTYDPYNPEKIDVPSPEDFKGEDLPQFEDAARSSEPKSLPEEKILEPEEPFAEKSNSAIKPIVKPIELYIRGSAYSKVFIELNQMSKALSRIDAQTENYEEMVKREEPLFTLAKEQMEYAYRRLSLIDKKIFVQ